MAQNYRKRNIRIRPDPNYFISCNACSIDFNQNFSFFGMWWLHYIFFIYKILRSTAEFMDTNRIHTPNNCINISIYVLHGVDWLTYWITKVTQVHSFDFINYMLNLALSYYFHASHTEHLIYKPEYK